MKVIIVISTTFLLIVLFACNKEKINNNVIVLLDLSRSRDSSTIAWYEQVIKENIIRKMGAKDRITIIPIDGSSVLWSKEIMTYDFGTGSYSNEFAGLQEKEVEAQNLQDTISSVIAQFEINVSKARNERVEFSKGTDVIGAIQQAVKYIIPGNRNTIIMLSDMEQSDSDNRVDLKRVTKKQGVDSLINGLEKTDLLASNVIVVTGSQATMDKQRFSTMKLFWERYFEVSNAKLLDYSTGSLTALDRTLTSNLEGK